MPHLLKEWSVVCQALDEGVQTLIARKGGLLDEDGIFQVVHSEFYLFPTYLHQHRSHVKARYQSLFDRIPEETTSEGTIVLKNFAQVTDHTFVRDWPHLQTLDNFHIWTEDFLRQKFHWGGQQGLFLLTLRVFRLQVPLEIPLKPHYAGCKSWVEFEEEIPMQPMTPILSDQEFSSRRERIRKVFRSVPTGSVRG